MAPSATAGQRVASDRAAIDFLRELVATPSVSGDESRAVALFTRFAASLGFETAVDKAGNGIARRGAGDQRRVVLLGHIDTVPGVIPVRLENGVLHGRGSVDAKGPLAALLVGASRAPLTPDATVEVVACVGEEAPESLGARHYLATAPRADACIVGEPSAWDGVTLGYKGRLIGEATCRLDGAHSASARGSAGDALVAWWSSVLGWADAFNASRSGAFETLQASIIAWSSNDDGLADEARLRVGFRVPASIGASELAARLERLPHSDGIALAWRGMTDAHRVGRDDAVVRALSSAIASAGGRARHKVKTGTADFNLVGPAWACPIAAYGPGDSALDHTPEERLEIDEFLRAIAIIAQSVEMLARD